MLIMLKMQYLLTVQLTTEPILTTLTMLRMPYMLTPLVSTTELTPTTLMMLKMPFLHMLQLIMEPGLTMLMTFRMLITMKLHNTGQEDSQMIKRMLSLLILQSTIPV